MTNLKPLILLLALASTLTVLSTGCRPTQKETKNENQTTPLSAEELAALQDFHFWKFALPESNEPYDAIRLVIVRPDKKDIVKFSFGSLNTSSKSTTVLLGLREESGVYSGNMQIQYPGGAYTRKINFTNEAPEHPCIWTSGSSRFTGMEGYQCWLATYCSERAEGATNEETGRLAIKVIK